MKKLLTFAFTILLSVNTLASNTKTIYAELEKNGDKIVVKNKATANTIPFVLEEETTNTSFKIRDGKLVIRDPKMIKTIKEITENKKRKDLTLKEKIFWFTILAGIITVAGFAIHDDIKQEQKLVQSLIKEGFSPNAAKSLAAASRRPSYFFHY